MSDSQPSFFVRFFAAFGVFFRVLFDAEFAARVTRPELPAEAPEPAPAPEPTPAPALVEHDAGAALQLLSVLQREGRLIDFLQEDVTGYADADIGAAARVVHDACKKALDHVVTLEPVRSEPEGSRLTLPDGFDASQVRLTGNVVGQPPFTGALNHRGWRASRIELPKLTPGHDVHVIAPAEVEL